jgi:hypothetical protein
MERVKPVIRGTTRDLKNSYNPYNYNPNATSGKATNSNDTGNNSNSAMSAAGGVWIQPSHEQYDMIVHQLKLSIVDGRVPTDVEIWQIENGEFADSYRKRSENLLRLPSWSNPDLLGDLNSVREVCTRGQFQFGPQGYMEFSTGVVDLPSTSKQPNKPMSLLFSEIAVGRSYVIDDLQAIAQKQRQSRGTGGAAGSLPAGFDSYYLTAEPLDRNHDGEFSLAEYQAAASFDNRDPKYYRHRYVFTDSTLVLPKYVVRFQLPPIGTFMPSSSPKKGVRPSSNLSSTIGPLNSTDSNVNISNASLITEYFDMTHFRPLSKVQKDACNEAEVRIYTIDDAYDKACLELGYLDPLVSGKMEWVEKQMDTIEERVRVVNLNYAEVADKLAEAYKKAMDDLNSITRKKLQVLLSAEIELRRQKEQMNWIQLHSETAMQRTEALLNGKVGGFAPSYQEKKDAKLQLLSVWKCQVALRNELSRLRDSKPHTKAMNAVRADTSAHIVMEVIEGSQSYSASVAAASASTNVGGNVAAPARGLSHSDLRAAIDEYGDFGRDDDDDDYNNLDDIKALLHPVYTGTQRNVNFGASEGMAGAADTVGTTQMHTYQRFIDTQTKKIKAILAEKAFVGTNSGSVGNVSVATAQKTDAPSVTVPLPSSIFSAGGVLGTKYCVEIPSAIVATHPPSSAGGLQQSLSASSSSSRPPHRRQYVDPKALFKDVMREVIDPEYAQNNSFVMSGTDVRHRPLYATNKDSPRNKDNIAFNKRTTKQKSIKDAEKERLDTIDLDALLESSEDEVDDVDLSEEEELAASGAGDSPRLPEADTVPSKQSKQPKQPVSHVSKHPPTRKQRSSSPTSSIADSVASKHSKSSLGLGKFMKSLIGIKSGDKAKEADPEPKQESKLSKAPSSVDGSVRPQMSRTSSATGPVKNKSVSSAGGGSNVQKSKQSKKPTALATIEERSIESSTVVTNPQLLGAAGAGAHDYRDYADVDHHHIQKYSLPIVTLRKVAINYHPQLSMKSLSERKQAQLRARHVITSDAFGPAIEESLNELTSQSNILALSEAQSLYFCLPFLSKPPKVGLLYSTALHPRSLKELYMRNVPVRFALSNYVIFLIRLLFLLVCVYFSEPGTVRDDCSLGRLCIWRLLFALAHSFW